MTATRRMSIARRNSVVVPSSHRAKARMYIVGWLPTIGATERGGDETMPEIDTEHRQDVARLPLESARETAVNDLAERASSAHLTLDDYAERAVAVEQAASVEELDAAVRGLSEQAGATTEAHAGRWLIGVFGGTQQRGRWRLSSRLRVVAVLGGVTLDLGLAEPEAPESLITVVAVLGGVEIIAPPGVPVQLSGFSLLGGKSDERSGGPPLPGSPLVRVRCITLLGGVKVKDRPPRRNLLDVIRARGGRPTTPDGTAPDTGQGV